MRKNRNNGAKRIRAVILAAALAGMSMMSAAAAEDDMKPVSSEEMKSDGAGYCMAGISQSLLGYYDSVMNGEVEADTELELMILTSESRSVLQDYTNLGLVDLEYGYLNVRTEPDTEAEICGKMVGYTGCEILDETDGWYYISSGPVVGYVSSEYVLTGESAVLKALEVAELRAVVITDGLNLREEPNAESAIVNMVGNDERYVVVGESEDGNWIKINVDDIEGYVSREYIDVRYALDEAVEFHPVTAAPLRTQIVDFALQYLGRPYVWGGESLENGVDCSGFTKKVMEQYGIYLSHYSGAQANEGITVSMDQIRPGDLVFYASSGTIDHVAIYIGNGQIVHASSPQTGIIISSVQSRSLVKAVNVIGD